MKQSVSVTVFCLLFLLSMWSEPTVEAQGSRKAPISDETQSCLNCHELYSPGMTVDWRSSRHAQVSPGQALEKPQLERRVSAQNITEDLLPHAVGCYECHSLNASLHGDNFEHFGEQINIVVSPNDCQTCHPAEALEYGQSKKAHAHDNLRQNPVHSALVEGILSLKNAERGKVIPQSASDVTKGETCYNCHGTRVSVTGTKTVSVDMGEVEVPALENWPNQGVGRINPDGSRGSCTACHPRHSFSIEIARKPYTCGQCHLEPDVPSYNIYKESKHGNIFDSKKESWTWDAVPWQVGYDFKAPTCATCHSSLVTSLTGEQILPRTHNFGSRLWTRLFGLVYSHPQPKSGATHVIRNSDGLPLPTTFAGELASEYLISHEEQTGRKDNFKKVCRSCHGSSWADGHFTQLDTTIKESDGMVRAATQLVQYAWDKDLADQSDLFDETIEQMWARQWLFYANSIRYASAMAGPDYAGFKNGWWEATHNLRLIEDHIRFLRDN